MPGNEQNSLEPRFDLVYEGPVDDSLRTLQRIKGVFLADLNLSIPDIQRVLNSAPVSVSSAPSEAELQDPLAKLRQAGARVLIVQQSTNGNSANADALMQQLLKDEPSSAGASSAVVETVMAATPLPPQPASAPQIPSTEITFEFDLDSPQAGAKPAAASAPREAKVYALDLDATEDPASLAASLDDAELHQESLPPAEPPPSENKGFTLLSEEELKEFHLSRGGSLEAPPPSIQDEEPSDHLDTTSLTASTELPDPPSSAPDTSLLGVDPEAPPSAAEVALVLEEVSSQLQDSPLTAAAKPTSGLTPPSQAAIPANPKPAKPKIPEASSSELALELDAEIPEATPPPPAPKNDLAPKASVSAISPQQKSGPVAPSAPTKSDDSLALSSEEGGPQIQWQNSEPANTPAPLAPPPQTPPKVPSFAEAVPEKTSPPPPPKLAEAQSAPRVSQPRKKPAKKSALGSLLEFGIPIAVGVVVLTIANWYYFNATPPTPLPSTSAAAEKKAAAPKKIEPTKAPAEVWSAQSQQSDRSVNLALEFAPDRVTLQSMSMDFPPMRERTIEEIAQGVVLPPAPRRAEIASAVAFLVPDTSPTNKTYAVQTKALLYLDYQGKSSRLAGQLNVQISIDKTTDRALVTYHLSAGKEIPPPEQPTITAVHHEDGSFSVIVDGELSASKPASQAPPSHDASPAASAASNQAPAQGVTHAAEATAESKIESENAAAPSGSESPK